MPTKSLPYESPWSAPYRRTVLEDAVQKGIQRVSNAGEGVSPGLWGGLGKTAATDQDVVGGLLQALSAPVISVGSMAAPLMEAMKGQYFPTPGDLFGGKPKTFGDVFGAPGQVANNLGDAFSKLSGYPQDRSRELGGLMVGAAAPGAIGAGGKVEGLLNKVGMTTEKAPNQLNTFISLTQKNNLPSSSYEALAQALELDKQGLPMNDIFEQTGVFKHPLDKDWRTEISDKGAKLKFTPQQLLDLRKSGDLRFMRLPEILDHPELFEKYPYAKDFALDGHMADGSSYYKNTAPTFPPEDYVNRGVNPAPGQIQLSLADRDHSVSNPLLASESEIMDRLLHEVQHGIQGLNPLASGGTNVRQAGSFQKYLRDAGELEARLVEARKDLPSDELRKLYPYMTDTVDMLHPRHASAYTSPYLNSELSSHNRTPPGEVQDWDSFYRRLDALKKKRNQP
jgi:hypothetical protein